VAQSSKQNDDTVIVGQVYRLVHPLFGHGQRNGLEGDGFKHAYTLTLGEVLTMNYIWRFLGHGGS
jgi:hypothetical protein